MKDGLNLHAPSYSTSQLQHDSTATEVDVFTNKGMSLVSFNIVTLPGNLDEFLHFMCNNPVDIIALNETRLESNIPDNEINIDGYDLYRNDRNREGGGVAIYINNKSGFTHKVRNDLMPPELELITIEVASPKSKPIIVISWYRPPNWYCVIYWGT